MKRLSFSSEHSEQITWRSILISLFLLPFLYWWHITCEALPSFGPPPTLMAPFYTVVFVLLILAVANLTLKRFLPKNALTRGELISIYVFLSILGLFMSYDMFLPLVSIIVHAFYFASPENEWRDLFWSYLPDWLTINDSDAVRAFYLGDESIFEIRHFLAWVKPTFWWCTFTFVLLFVMQCINVIIRKRWVEQERLVYPIVELPHQIAYNTNSFLRNKPMWLGFAVAASISLINGLSVLFPSIPSIPNKSIPLHALFSEKPWTAFLAGGSSIIIYPFAVGLSFLMPLDLLGSCLLFFLLYKIQIFVGILAGLEKMPGYPYAYEQNIGAYTGISVIVLWTARRQIWGAFQQAIQNKPTEDAAEPMQYRTAFLGIVLGGIFLVGFGMRGGMALWIAVLFFAAHFLTIAIALTRIRAQIGLSIHNTTSIGPHHSLVSLIGSRRIGAQNLTWFSLFFWFNRDNRSHPMPHQLEAFKLAERNNLDSKGLSRWMVGLMVIAMPLCIMMLLDTFYKLGVDSGRVGAQINSFGSRAYRLLHHSFIMPQDSQPAHIAGMVIGFSFTLLLAAVRGLLFWWPIHPLGYGVAFHIHMFWAAFTISAIAKWSLLKYGGIGLYRKAVPLFIGLVLGDFTVGSIWSILGIALNTRTYTFYY